MMPAGNGTLRARIEAEAKGEACTLSELTVLENDPYRFDTPGWRQAGGWFAERVEVLLEAQRAAGVRKDSVHNRGMHYSVAGVTKPTNGEPYVLTRDKDWKWLGDVSAAARWLKIVPFKTIIDERNGAPLIRPILDDAATPTIDLGLQVDLPAADDLHPQVWIPPYPLYQPFRLVLFGEKSSLEPILGELSERYTTDLFLPGGEMSSTQCYDLAEAAAEDGRKVVLFTFSDADPSGYQMPISIARKLQALRDGFFPSLQFEVLPVGLLPADAKAMGLPESPLGAKEQRANAWRAAFGIEQVEIDSLAALRPADLMQMATRTIDPFFDHGLARRAVKARRVWLEQAQEAIDNRLDQDLLERIRAEAADRLGEMAEVIERLNRDMQTAIPEDLQAELPEIEVPEAELGGGQRPPSLVSSAWSWLDQTKALIARKRYGGGA